MEHLTPMDKNNVLALLKTAGTSFEVTEHAPVYTVEEGETLKLPHPESIARTLFLCDDKHQNFWLVALPKDKKLDLKALRVQLNSRRLTFATAEELDAMLKLPPGSVTPLGALNDATGTVPVLIDAEFNGRLIGVPLFANTTTIWLNSADLAQILAQQGHSVNWLAL